MDELDQQLASLHAAEDFFAVLDVPYEPAVIHVNRLHILKRFNQYLRRDGRGDGLAPADKKAHFAKLLGQAYDDFVRSTPAQEKVFKVFQDQASKSVSLDALRAELPGTR